LDSLLRDIRYGVRGLLRAPGFTAVALVILGLGIGANTTIFTLVSSLFLQSPPGVADPDRLVRVNRTSEYSNSSSLSFPDYEYYRDNNSVFSGLAATGAEPVLVMLRSPSGDVQAATTLVSGNYFAVLGVRPALGRFFLPEEHETPGARPVAVLSYGFWSRELGGDSTIVGSEVDINGHRFTVVGVAPPAFRGVSPLGSSPDLWVPLMMQPVVMPAASDMLRRVPGQIQVWLQGIGRLRPGVALAGAQANMTALAKQLEEVDPENEGHGAGLTEHFQYRPTVRERLVSLTRLLLIVTGFVLLIACANLAILLLARASTRERELGVRRALGAGRQRIARLLVIEGLLLACLGGVAGMGLAIWTADAAAALLPVSLNVSVRPDLTVIGFTLGLCVATTLVFALAPAWTATRTDIAEVIKGASRAVRPSRFRSALVVGQVGLAIVLVCGAALFLRSFTSAQAVDPGFELADRLVLEFDLRNQGYSEDEGRRFIRDALERVGAMPDVASVTTTRMVPLGRGVWSGSFLAEGVEPPGDQPYFDAGFNAVGPGYFETIGIPLLAGRGFTTRDDAGAPGVVVVNQALAEMIWRDESPIGRRVGGDGEWFTVVGVARNASYYELGETPQPQLYVPVLQRYVPRVNLLVESRGSAKGLLRPVQAELRTLDPRLVIAAARTLEDVFAGTLGNYRVLATLVTIFGTLALALAAVGLYGVLSYLVAQRTREFGVRIALGARREQVIRMVLGRGLKLALLGIGGGALVGWFAARTVRGFLFGIDPHDPVTFAAVPAVLAAVAALAAYLPARRAASVDPMKAIRQE